MKIPDGLTAQEIRVIQEFRRMSTETLTAEQVGSIKHPVGGGETPARDLAAKGYLAAAADGASFSLTGKAREFLAIDWKPYSERG